MIFISSLFGMFVIFTMKEKRKIHSNDQVYFIFKTTQQFDLGIVKFISSLYSSIKSVIILHRDNIKKK